MMPKPRLQPSRVATPKLMLLVLCLASSAATAQTAAQAPAPVTQATDDDAPATPAKRREEAWRMLTQAAADKRPDTRIQALAALGTLPEPRAHALIETALADPDLDTRTAAILAVGQTASAPKRDLRLMASCMPCSTTRSRRWPSSPPPRSGS